MPRAFTLLLPWLLACAVALVPAAAKSASREKFFDTVAASSEIAWQAIDAAKEDCFDYDEIASGDSLYNYFRDYNPNTGRYQQSDPIGLSGGFNTYLYVFGDPVSGFDPTGLARKPGSGHSATGTISRNGKPICSNTVRSGGAKSRSWSDQRASDTEAKLCAWARQCGKAGDVLGISGTLPPCNNCKGAMNALQRDCGIQSCYTWPGGSWSSGGGRGGGGPFGGGRGPFRK